jgi:hypothetical protein
LFPRIRKDFKEKSSIPAACGGDSLLVHPKKQEVVGAHGDKIRNVVK